MPFVSDAQRKFLFAKHPSVAKEFAAATPKGKKLPEHVESRETHMKKPPKAPPFRGKSASAPGQLKKAQGLKSASSIAKAKRPELPERPAAKPVAAKPTLPAPKTPPIPVKRPEPPEPRLPIPDKARVAIKALASRSR